MFQYSIDTEAHRGRRHADTPRPTPPRLAPPYRAGAVPCVPVPASAWHGTAGKGIEDSNGWMQTQSKFNIAELAAQVYMCVDMCLACLCL